jgi:hypothetical protein
MVKRYQRGNQNLYTEEEQTTQWPKDTKTDYDYPFGIFSSSLDMQYSVKTLKITYCCMRGYLQKYLHKFHESEIKSEIKSVNKTKQKI